jgi:molybdate transport system substrate-binding protein
MKKIVFCILALIFVMSLGAQEKVSVAAAANISSVSEPLKAVFAKNNPDYEIEFTFGASGALITQILNGAPFQVYLSADMGFPQKLVDADMTAGPVKPYAVGKLIFLTVENLDLSHGMSVLLDPGVAQFAGINPETSPYGRAAEQALKNAGIYDRVKGKLVIAQTVTQALQFILTSADAGFVNKSALYSKDVKPWDKEGTHWFQVDPKLYPPIEQGFVVMKSAASFPAVLAFSRFLLSAEAQAVFEAFGYGKP